VNGETLIKDDWHETVDGGKMAGMEVEALKLEFEWQRNHECFRMDRPYIVLNRVVLRVGLW
jgi:hypothetical protein